MVREVVKIDEELCDGCGLCVPGCHEGALQIIDGKAQRFDVRWSGSMHWSLPPGCNYNRKAGSRSIQ